uniref:Nucleolar protein n=1 Tax=Anopheles farauti TaxID=69004 RepID=A0A182QAB3_9DIPT
MVVKQDEAVIATESTTNAKKMDNKASIVAQEIKFARLLAGNDATMRRRVLKNLKTWLSTRSQSTFAFSDGDFLRLWKGLFYCMWMSDKPLVQEELAESLGSLLHCFDHNVPIAMQFFKAFLTTMGNEWFGIDRWRIDKFMMLVRRITRQALVALHEAGWQPEHVEHFTKCIDETIMNRNIVSYGLMNHFNDLFLNELAKVSDGEIPKPIVTQILDVFVRHMLTTDDNTVSQSIKRNIFHSLMQQSELGQMFEEKFAMWKERNFVSGNINNVEFVDEEDLENGEEDGDAGTGDGDDGDQEGSENNQTEQEGGEEVNGDEEEEAKKDAKDTEKVLDPRAGRVNVDIPQIEFDPLEIVELFEKHRYKSYVTTSGKKRAVEMVRQFTKFAEGEYPLGVKSVPSINPRDYDVDIEETVQELEKFRKDLVGEKPKSMKERKKERRLQKKLQRAQLEAKREKKAAQKAVAEAGETNGTADQTDEVDDSGDAVEQEQEVAVPAAEKVAKNKKRRVRLPKVSPAMARKQAKLELLQRKKEEKMKLLVERLKKKKKNSANTVSDEVVPQLVPITEPEQKPKNQTSDAPGESLAKKTKKKVQTNGKPATVTTTNDSKPFATNDEWSEPLKEGEEEYFIPSRKLKAVTPKSEKLSTEVKTPVMKKSASLKRASSTPVAALADGEDPSTPARKRVKIALNKNVAQDLVEHIKQVKSSPQLPFDSSKKPSKSLLKPNLIPSPINPFYKKKIGLK